MKPHKLIGALVTSCLVMGLVTANAAPAALAAGNSTGNLRVYVSPDGNDTSKEGNRGRPFATIQRAVDYLAEHKRARKAAQVFVLDGQYSIDEPIKLTSAHSGITITAAPGASPELVGSDRLDPEKFRSVSELEGLGGRFESANRIPTEHRGDVVVYDLGADGLEVGEIKKNGFNWNINTYPPELVVHGVPQTVARYPNKVNGETAFMPGSDIGYAYRPTGNLVPRENFQDKVAGNDPDLAMTFEEMRQLPSPRFRVQNSSLVPRISTWAAPTTAVEKTWPDNQVGTKPLKTEQPEVLAAQDPTKYETDGWLSGFIGIEWADDMLQIYSYDSSDNTFRARLPSMYTNFVHQVFGENILSELDAPGEFYVDRWNGNDVLYYYPAEGSDLSDVSWKAYDGSFFELTGTENVTISGLKMRDTLGSAIEILDGESNLIDNVEITGTGSDAITIGQNKGLITASPDYHTVRGGRHHRVENSYLHNLGAGGILLGGGDRKSLEPGSNSARHNKIENFSRLGTYMPAGYLYGVGNSFEFNEVSDSPHMAIQVMGNDMSIKFNHIKDVLKTTSDMGAIYAGRDWTYLGNEIAYNVIEDLTPASHANQAVYLDDNAGGFDIHDNLFLNPGNRGVFLNKSRNISVEDNITFWDAAPGPGSREWLRTWSNYTGPGSGPGLENRWTLVTRFQDMLTTGDDVDAVAPKGYEESFGNSAENIAKWKQHYAEKYPRIATPDQPRGSGYYVPRTAAGAICTSYTGDGECDEAGTWLNPHSVYASTADSVIHNNVSARGGNGNFGSNRYPGGGTYFNGPQHNKELFVPSTTAEVDAVKLDTATWTLGEGSSLANAAGFGEQWVQRWNAILGYAKAHVGPVTGPVDGTAFQAAVDVAEEIDVSNRPTHTVDRFQAALERAHAVVADDDADWAAFDAALIDLLDAAAVVAKAPYVSAADVIVGQPLTIQAFRMQPGTAEVFFDDTPAGTLEVAGNGSLTGQVAVPAGIEDGATLTVRSGATTASTQLTVIADAGLVVPETGQIGRQLRVDAGGFVPDERVTFTVAGQPVETIAREKYADADGVFAGYIFLPATLATGQDMTVTGVGGSSGRSYSAITTLMAPDSFAKIDSAEASSTHEASKAVSNTFDGNRTTAWWSVQGDFPAHRPSVTYTLDKPARISELTLAADNEARYAKAGPAEVFVEVLGEDGTWTTAGSWRAVDDPTYAHILAGADGNNMWDLPALHDVTIELDNVVTQTFRVTITESFDADRKLADARFTALAQVYVTSTDPASPPPEPTVVEVTTDPVAPDGRDGWFVTAPVVVTAAATDDSGDSDRIEVRVGDSDWADYTGPVEVTAVLTDLRTALEVAVAAADATSGVTEVTLSLGGEEIGSPATIAPAFGTHVLVATATDAAGNVAELTVSFTVKATYPATLGLLAALRKDGTLSPGEYIWLRLPLHVAGWLDRIGQVRLAALALDGFAAIVERVKDGQARAELLAIAEALRSPPKAA